MKISKKTYAALAFGLLLVASSVGIYFYLTKLSPRAAAVRALVNGDFYYLEKKLNASQKNFEQKKLSVQELSDKYEDLSELDRLVEKSTAEKRLNEWVSKFPNSYAAKMIRGNYFADMADIARGELSSANTTEKQFSEMRRFQQLALADLEESIKLTEFPLTSHVRIISISTTASSEALKNENYLKATAISPSNMILHQQMLYNLQPRWGGSYDAMLKYIETVGPKLENQKDQLALIAIIKADKADGLMRLEKFDESYALYSEVIASTATSHYLCSRAYIAHKLKKEPATIVQDLKQAGMKKNPANYCASRVEVFVIENAQSEDASPLIDAYLEHFPKNPELHSAKGWILQERGDQPSAYKSFLKSAELGGVYGQTMAGKYLFSGWGGPVDREKAMVYLRNAAEKGEKNAQLSMVQALQFLGRNDESIKLKLRYETMSTPAKN